MRRPLTLGESSRVKLSQCLDCGAPNDSAAAVGCEAKPQPGDITICLRCGHLMAFGDDLALRQLTDAEVIEIAGDERIIAVQKLRGMVKR